MTIPGNESNKLAPVGEEISLVYEAAKRIVDNVQKVIVGKEKAIRLVLTALFCEGHVLLEDVPGVGKTLLAKAMARSLNCSFKRIQFTPDLLPSDVTGLNFFNQQTSDFQFLPGPIIANIVLADEINRATPRTQSCLLEAMQERQITVDADTMSLPRPFLVLATQNPIEQEGTFPLPEAQLDRFLIMVKQGYPTPGQEEEIIMRFEQSNPLNGLGPVIEKDELMTLQTLCRKVFVEPSVRQYIVGICRSTREHEAVRLGASPRAAQGLYRAVQTMAAMNGRDYALPDDVKMLAGPVIGHRLVVKAEYTLKGRSGVEVVEEIIENAKAPVE